MMSMGMGGMGASGGQAWFVNDLGQTVGQAQMPGGNHHAFAGSGGMMGGMTMDLGTLGGTNSIAYCINNGGDVVGTAEMSNGVHHAFMVTNAVSAMAGMMDLNDLIPTNSGWEMMEARGINASGQIVGWGMHAGHTNAFLLTPVSAPVMMVSGPSGQIVGPGAAVTMEMHMSASEPLTYQWLHDGMAIPGATNATLMLPGMNMETAGQYMVTARNAVGTVANSSATIGMFQMMVSNESPLLHMAAPAGTRFRIDHTDMMGPITVWQTMTNFTMMGSMSQMNVAPEQGSHAGFYRAVMMP